MAKIRQGVIGALRTQEGEFVFLPAVPTEDFSKQERVRGETEYFQITSETLGFISEAIKAEDFIPGRNIKEVFLSAFLRGAYREFGLEISSQQIESDPADLGMIEQIRKSEEVLFLVKIIASVVLTDLQLAQLENAAGEIEIAPSRELRQFIEENKGRIRPAARLAAQGIYQSAQPVQ